MVKIISAVPARDIGSNIFIYSFDGLSTDSKPIKPNHAAGIMSIADRSLFLELDTGDIYSYSTVNINPTTGNNWWKE